MCTQCACEVILLVTGGMHVRLRRGRGWGAYLPLVIAAKSANALSIDVQLIIPYECTTVYYSAAYTGIKSTNEKM